ncbi:MAG TPA: GMC family oxidoreductase [Thermodesulfobacteriota bacterium]|nr:GMC family oxidoreductase [Thermodesulfobacteriota bacterium]
MRKLSRRSFLIGLAGAASAVASWLSFPRLRELFPGLYNRLLQKPGNLPSPSLRLYSPKDLNQSGQFDVCIIGSGPAGSVLAMSLAHNGSKILILESGLDLSHSDPRVQKLDVYRSSGPVTYPVVATRLRALGGASNLWTGRCSRLHPLDFEKNAYTPDDAHWPITYDQLEPYYERAEKTLRVRGGHLSNYHPPRKNALPLPPDTDIAALKSLMRKAGITVDYSSTSTGRFGKGPVKTARDLLPDISISPNARIISGVTVTELVPDPDGRIVNVVVKTLDGESRQIRARVYVIACGALESTRLLLLSRSQTFPEGIGNRYNLVGSCFTEHPNLIFSGKITYDKPPPHFQLGRSHQFYEQFKKQGMGSVILAFYWEPKTPGILKIAATLEMRPMDKNLVSLASDLKDYFGSPGLDVSLSFSDDDIRTMDHARSLVKSIYSELGGGDVQEEPMSWSHHHIGTCRMGDDPKRSVVDRNLRVHDSPNLYVASSAVFVTGGAAHPTLSITALSHRLADHLIARLRDENI